MKSFFHRTVSLIVLGAFLFGFHDLSALIPEQHPLPQCSMGAQCCCEGECSSQARTCPLSHAGLAVQSVPCSSQTPASIFSSQSQKDIASASELPQTPRVFAHVQSWLSLHD